MNARIAGSLLVLLARVIASDALAEAERFTGVWEGVEHAEATEKPVGFVLGPRGAHGLGGEFYFRREDFGGLEDARITGDSLTFHVGSLEFYALLTSADRLAVRAIAGPGKIHDFVVTRVSADTTKRSATTGNFAPPPPLARDEAPDSVRIAHRQASSASSSADPSLFQGTLLLIGGGANDDDIVARFVHLAGGRSGRIVVIPTASVRTANPEETRGIAERTARVLGVPGVTVLHTVSRAEANSEAFVAPLRHATGVWILGGEGSYLVDSYLGTRTETELTALLARGGVIGGSSAGALIWGSQALLYKAHAGGPLFQIEKADDLVIGDPHEVMFGVLRNVLIEPHFTQFKSASAMDRILSTNPRLLGIGIDENTAIEVHTNQFVVLGAGSVFVYNGLHSKGAPLVLKRGARYDLEKRAAL